MARVRAVLSWLWKANRRNWRSFGSFTGNNLFCTGLALLFMSDSPAFIFFTVLIGIVLFFPLSNDPLAAAPPERLALWPLRDAERRMLRVISPFLNPLALPLCALLVWKRVSAGLALGAIGLFGIGFAAASRGVEGQTFMWRWMPRFPGPLNQLVRKNFRELLSTLDLYGGLLLAAPAAFLRARGLLPPEALLPLTLVIVLAISTHAQCLFGLDGEGGMTRYRLLPVPGWQILAAKDVCFLLAALVLTLPLSPMAGLAAAFAALAVGHYASVKQRRQQKRWRFQAGASFGRSIVQVIFTVVTGAEAAACGPLVTAAAVAAYVWSTWRCGRMMEGG